MPKIAQEAQDLIDQWTKGLEVVTTIQPFPDMIMTVAKDDKDLYHATAYFTIGNRWNVSADAQRVSADEAFKAIARRFS